MNPIHEPTEFKIENIDLSKLSFRSLCEIYANSFGICIWEEIGATNLRKTIEHQRDKGNIKFPTHPSENLLNDLRSILNP